MHAVSHASREVPPEYLLPEGMSLGTHVVIDDHGQVQKLLEDKMALASRQAKATKGYSPMWEGVINLPEPSPDLPLARQVEIVKAWCVEYEKMTGHQVIRADVHLDEGFVDEAGKPHFNAHAHVMCDRTDDKGRVKKLTSTVLREVQNMTANVTTLQRGLDARTTGRKHINHHNFKFDAEKNRLNLDVEKGNTAREARLVDASIERARTAKAQVLDLKGQIAQLKAQYDQDRATLKASGEATQKAYQALKISHEAALAALKESTKKVEKMEKQIAQLTDENAKLESDKAKFAAMAKEYQDAKAAGTPAHLIVPGEAPSTPTRGAKPGLSEGSQGGSTASLHGPRAIEQPKTPPEQPKTKNPDIPTPEPEKSHLEAFKASMKEFYQGWVDFIKSKGFTHAELDASKGQYRGKILDTDDLFAVQKTGRDTCVIHLLSDLDTTPDLENPDIFIRYKDGRGQVTGQLDPEKYPRPGVGR